MSDIRGPLHALSLAVVDPINQHRHLPPDQKRLAHLSLAAHSLGWCLYLCPLFKTGPYLAAVLIGAALFGNGHAPDMWLPVGAWGVLTAVSVLWLLSAWRGARQYFGRDFGMAFGRLLLTGAMAVLLWFRVWPDDWPLVVLILKGFYVAWGFSHAVRFLFAAQLSGGGNARGKIEREVRRRNAPLRPARRRRFFFF
jgi:hypothetical protein